MKARVQLRYGQNKPIMALGQSDRHHVRSYTGQAMTPTKVAREDVMPEIPEKKKKLPISKTYNSNNWLLLLILRTKEGRKSKLSRKKCSRDFFFRFTGDLSQHINALEKLRDKFGKFTDKYVIRNIFFFGFIICILFQINWINYFARKCIALHDLEIAHLYWYH